MCKYHSRAISLPAHSLNAEKHARCRLLLGGSLKLYAELYTQLLSSRCVLAASRCCARTTAIRPTCGPWVSSCTSCSAACLPFGATQRTRSSGWCVTAGLNSCDCWQHRKSSQLCFKYLQHCLPLGRSMVDTRSRWLNSHAWPMPIAVVPHVDLALPLVSNRIRA